MGIKGPPVSKLTQALSTLKKGQSIFVPKSKQSTLHTRARRLGIRIATRRIPIGVNAGKVEVFRIA